MGVRGMIIAAAVLVAPTAASTAAPAVTPPYAIPPPATLHTEQACYVAGQSVELTGTGFAPDTPYLATIAGVNWTPGRFPTTDGNGSFTTRGRPGVAFSGTRVEVRLTVVVTDGISTARTSFTVTRTPGALLETGPRTTVASRVPVLVWGFAVNKPPTEVYLHYVEPSGRVRKILAVGRTTGPCGYLRGSLRRLFPFAVTRGVWTLQVDTDRSYFRQPVGPMHRFSLRIG